MTQSLAAVVLCAGKGTRMKSDRAKVLHPILGRPLAWYPITSAYELGAQQVVAVVGHQADDVKNALTAGFPGQALQFAVQATQRGTGDAVSAARGALTGFSGAVLVLYGDVPLLTVETLKRLIAAYDPSKGPLAMISCRLADPTGYGRVLRGAGHKVEGIVEHKDATAEQKLIAEVNAGIYVVDSKFLWGALEKLTPQNAQGELYLTDIVSQAARVGTVAVIEAPAEETAGVNDRAELAERAEIIRARINLRHMRAGVSLVHPASTFIDAGVEIGPETTIGPNVSIQGECEIGANATIGQGSVLVHTTVGDGAEVKPYSVTDEAVIGPRCHVGPFARLRPGTVLEEGVHVGNFVETKKARLRKGTKAGHLAYLGDADIGPGCNIGAGTITCNYDGVSKHETVLGAGVFIGSDTQLVAPVRIGDGAFIGAGSTITQDVPAGALSISRTPQTIKEGWAERRRKVLAGLKQD
ncbi:MAG: bifunctional UDP-N-acetylglucosamine diphosphorylase/glucosamine-1-phosphate N-acetyltransferase GlmU [Archangium sp.]|nr:bifunctional UDP-N-acetylglucosamine diphosphorylase/glucosamine-1-phosphate N-acetyltransferase GlmU [Archangium sp.]MDP3153884.1 bifunctional UDP-N-acetylglucosamine diphosphorylase/glucosamine-1-phosphate N-acetyltransferase GlmU [Archangium sp.]MDP3569385.1 bifunctional UDP-N-acetylglucosamine diphosphorylase/glucosamine-1-phosphate N-acetyltransferase GlmU [Archangium sp.]